MKENVDLDDFAGDSLGMRHSWDEERGASWEV